MAALVGGRMETVAPKRSLFGADYLLLAALVAVSTGLHFWLVAHTKVTARDSIGFARYALCIQSPESSNPAQPEDAKRLKFDVIREAEHPPGYPIAIWATAKFVRQTLTPEREGGKYSSRQLSESTLLAAQIANAIAGVLLVFPSYLIGRMLFGRSVGFAAALLFQVLPVPAHVTSDGLTEGVYLLGMLTALMLAVRAVRRPGVGIFLLAGLAIGAGYLVRPEAAMMLGAVGLVGAWLGFTRRWPRDLTLGRIAALGVGFLLVAGPYMILIEGISNKPSVKSPIPSLSPREEMLKKQPGAQAAPIAGPLFAKWLAPDETGLPHRAVRAVRAVLDETTKSLQYASALFAVVGIMALRRRIAREPGLALVLAMAAVNGAVLFYLGLSKGYVSERHTVLIAFIGCLFAAAALESIAAALGKLPAIGSFCSGPFGIPALLVILVGIALPSTLRPLHANREGFKHAGYWLADHVKPGEAVIDPFCWSGWYAGHTLYFVPVDPPGHKVRYAVVDDRTHPGGDDHALLERMIPARNVLADGRRELVYCWPEGSSEETAKVKIYKLEDK